MERHTVSRLIGAPPGYVGFDQGGLLTDGVDQHPHCVLLLDEIEKAHPDLFNILLQVMDHGKLTDHNGKQVDFRNVILIMTTNAGASELAKAGDRLRQVDARRRRHGGDQPPVRAGVPQPARRDRAVRQPAAGGRPPGRAEVRPAARGAARRPRRHLRPVRRRGEVAGREGLRHPHGRAAAGPGHPGAHQAAAGRRGAVRQAQEGRHGQGTGQDGRRRRDCARPRGDRRRAGHAEARAGAEGEAPAAQAYAETSDSSRAETAGRQARRRQAAGLFRRCR